MDYSVVKAFVTSLSLMMDISGLIGTAVFCFVVQQYKEHFLVAQSYRFLFMAMSIFAAVNSIIATKLILLFQYSTWALAFFVERAQESSFVNWGFRISLALFYSSTCMQILVISVVFLLSGEGPRVNRKVKRFDKFVMLAFLGISLIVGLPYYFYPIQMLTLGDDFTVPQTTSVWSDISLLALIPCAGLWAYCIRNSKGHRRLEVFIITFGMGAVILTISATHLAAYSEFKFVAQNAYIALPIASSLFSFSLLIGRITAYSVAREHLIEAIRCKRGARVGPPMNEGAITAWPVSDMSLDLRGI